MKDKPSFVDYLGYSKPKRKLSRAHIEFFAKLYPQIKAQVENSEMLAEIYWDGFTAINIIKYGTSDKNLITSFGLEDLVASKKLDIRWEDELVGITERTEE